MGRPEHHQWGLEQGMHHLQQIQQQQQHQQMQQQQLNMMLGENLNLSYFDAFYMVGSGLYSVTFRSFHPTAAPSLLPFSICQI